MITDKMKVFPWQFEIALYGFIWVSWWHINGILSSKNKHRPCQIGVWRLVSIKNWWFSGSMLIYQRVTTHLQPCWRPRSLKSMLRCRPGEEIGRRVVWSCGMPTIPAMVVENLELVDPVTQRTAPMFFSHQVTMDFAVEKAIENMVMRQKIHWI